MTNIVLLEDLGISKEKLEELEAPFIEKGCVFTHYEKTGDPETLKNEVKDADAVILANMPLKNEVVESSDSIKFIDVAFTGVDHIPLDVCRKKNIAVSNASGYSNEAVAELTLGMALSFTRNMRQLEDNCRNGQTKSGLIGYELKGKTVGIIGYGSIGSRSGELFHAFGCRILTLKGHRIKGNPDYVEAVEMEELLKQSDFVVLHCPLNESTRDLIHKETISRMKKTAVLINAARGPVVVSEDLKNALNAETIAGACIDVFDKEPPLDSTEPLLNAKNTLLTPHAAFATEESMILRAEIVFENLAGWLEGNQCNSVL